MEEWEKPGCTLHSNVETVLWPEAIHYGIDKLVTILN